MHMKKYILLIGMLGATIMVNAQSNEKVPYLVKTLTGESVKKIKLETTGGNITVTGSSSDLKLEVYITPGNSRESSMTKEEIKQRLEELYDLEINVTDNRLTAKARPKHR